MCLGEGDYLFFQVRVSYRPPVLFIFAPALLYQRKPASTQEVQLHPVGILCTCKRCTYRLMVNYHKLLLWVRPGVCLRISGRTCPSTVRILCHKSLRTQRSFNSGDLTQKSVRSNMSFSQAARPLLRKYVIPSSSSLQKAVLQPHDDSQESSDVPFSQDLSMSQSSSDCTMDCATDSNEILNAEIRSLCVVQCACQAETEVRCFNNSKNNKEKRCRRHSAMECLTLPSPFKRACSS